MRRVISRWLLAPSSLGLVFALAASSPWAHFIGQHAVSGGAGVDAVTFMGTTSAGSTKFHLGGGVNSHP
jgi:hypothetical protein